MKITILVKSSSQPEPRSVLVVPGDSGLSFVCDYPAGERGRICKHKNELVSVKEKARDIKEKITRIMKEGLK